MQFYYAMTILKKFAEYKGDTDYIAYLEEKQKQQGDVINESAGMKTVSSADLQRQERQSERERTTRQICG